MMETGVFFFILLLEIVNGRIGVAPVFFGDDFFDLGVTDVPHKGLAEAVFVLPVTPGDADGGTDIVSGALVERQTVVTQVLIDSTTDGEIFVRGDDGEVTPAIDGLFSFGEDEMLTPVVVDASVREGATNTDDFGDGVHLGKVEVVCGLVPQPNPLSG